MTNSLKNKKSQEFFDKFLLVFIQDEIRRIEPELNGEPGETIYYESAQDWKDDYGEGYQAEDDYINAQHCAMLAIDEMLKMLEEDKCWDNSSFLSKQHAYWIEIKQEIQKI